MIPSYGKETQVCSSLPLFYFHWPVSHFPLKKKNYHVYIQDKIYKASYSSVLQIIHTSHYCSIKFYEEGISVIKHNKIQVNKP